MIGLKYVVRTTTRSGDGGGTENKANTEADIIASSREWSLHDRRAMPLTLGEVVAAALTSGASATILVAYLLDLAGVTLLPGRLLPVTVVATAIVATTLRRQSRVMRGELLSYVAVVGSALVWLLWRAAPSFLPVGGGDLTHHLQLIDYIERHWRFVHDPTVEAYLGEMVHYTPGLHLLSALAGRWAGSDGLHLVHPIVALSVALKIGFVFLIALRVRADEPARVPIAMAAAVLLLLPRAYVLDSFMVDSFLAQAMAECFAVAAWWALVVWSAGPSATPMWLFALFSGAAFLTWPMWIGPPGVALGLVVLTRPTPSMSLRIRHGLIATIPVAALIGTYLAGRTAMLGMSGAAGAVLRPDIWTFDPVFLLLSGCGLIIASAALLRDGRRDASASPHDGWRAAPILGLVVGIALQAAVLYVQARIMGNASAYMTFKMFYLLPYPLAVLSALPLASLVRRITDRMHVTHTFAGLGWSVALLVIVGVYVAGVRAAGAYGGLGPRLFAGKPRSLRPIVPPLSESILEAGVWAREHLPPGCIAYMVPDDDTSYWLHLAVLRNPRMSERSADLATYDMNQTIIRWLEPVGLPYAIADMTAIPRDVRSEFDVLAAFDTAAVVSRKGPSECVDQNRPPAP